MMKKSCNKNGKETRLTVWLWLAAVAGVALAFLLAPHILRELSGKDELIGYDAYFHMRIADKGYSLASWQDNMVSASRTIRPTPYHVVLHFFQGTIGMRAAAIVLPLMIGIVCIVFLFWILALLHRPLLESIITLLAFILAPSFLFIGSTVTPDGLALALILLGSALFLTRRFWFLSAIPWGLLLFFTLFHILVVITLMFIAILIAKKERAHVLGIGSVLIGGAFLAQPPFFTLYHPIPPIPIVEVVADFGGYVGFGIFSLILVCIGILYSWKFKKTYYPAYLLAALGVFAMAGLGEIISVYLMPLAAVFIAIALLELRNRQWTIPILRSLTLVLIICGLLFSTISYMNRLASAKPDDALIDAARFLREISSRDDSILTHPAYGFVIETVANRPVVVDSFQPDPWFKHDVHELFSSRSAASVLGTLDTYDVSYLLIDRTIDEEDIWTGRNEGLLFVLRNGEIFKKVYETDSIEIWKVR